MKYILRCALSILLLSAAGCDYPRDVEGTTHRVEETHSLRVGIVEGADESKAQRVAGLIAEPADASINNRRGSAEILLRDLENGELDVVVGRFGKSSPWSKRVTFARSPYAQEASSDTPVLRPVLRKGENRWFMFIDKAMKGGSA